MSVKSETASMNSVRSILWVHTGSLTENLMAAGLFKAIADHYHEVALTVLTSDSAAWLYGNRPSPLKVITVDRERIKGDNAAQDRLLACLQVLHADLAINAMLERELVDDLLTLASEAPRRLAFHLGSAPGKQASPIPQEQLYTTLVPLDHSAEDVKWNYRAFLECLDIPIEDLKPQVRVSTDEQLRAEKQPAVKTHDSRPLKVALIASLDFGGAGNAAYRLHRSLLDQGVHSTMLALVKKSGDPTVKVLPADYPQGTVVRALEDDPRQRAWNISDRRWRHELQEYPNRPAGLEMFSDAESVVRLAQVEEVRQADVLNLHWIAGMVDYATAAEAFANKPVVWTLHDLHAFTGGCHYSSGCLKYQQSCGGCPSLGSDREQDLSRSVWLQKEALYSRAAVQVVTPSRWLAAEALKSSLFGRYPVQCIPYGLPLDTFRPYPAREARRELGFAPNDNVILFGAERVANLRKGFHFLPQTLDVLAKTSSHGNLTLAVFGELPPDFRSHQRFRIHSFGKISDDSLLAKIYSAADVFVLPALEDNLPNTVLEAMACGTPVVGFNIGGIPDMVDHQRTGFVAEPFKVESLAGGIEWVLTAKKEGLPLPRQCREKIERDYAPARQAGAYIDLFERLLRERFSADRAAIGV